jgi:hypothetical protein
MTYPKTKSDIVKLIVDQLKDDPDFAWKNKPHDKVIFEWFVTGRAGSGLRLTDAGKVAFEYAKIAHYEFDFSPPGVKSRDINAWHKYALVLDKKIKCPYYIGARQVEKTRKQPYIRLYDNKIAMMMTLYGDLQSYIDSIK